MAKPSAEQITMAAMIPAEMPAASATRLVLPLGQEEHPVELSHPAAQAEGQCVGVSTIPIFGSQ